ncbi:hypothetical protein BC828DRAFT_395873 [Blastocladiella britannica]|nr:hypothetical protein BC828DRAFT_395873 [Blastocladiella britannica]
MTAAPPRTDLVRLRHRHSTVLSRLSIGPRENPYHHAGDNDDDDIVLVSSSGSSRGPTLPPSQMPSLTGRGRHRHHAENDDGNDESAAALAALRDLVADYSGPLSFLQVDAIRSILSPPTRPVEADVAHTDTVLAQIAGITAFPAAVAAGQRRAAAAAAASSSASSVDDETDHSSVPLATKGRSAMIRKGLQKKLAELRAARAERDDQTAAMDPIGYALGTPSGRGGAVTVATPTAPAVEGDTPSRRPLRTVMREPQPFRGSGGMTAAPPEVAESALDRLILTVAAQARSGGSGSGGTRHIKAEPGIVATPDRAGGSAGSGSNGGATKPRRRIGGPRPASTLTEDWGGSNGLS